VSFVAAARAQDLVADARVVRRGKTICFCEVDVTDGGDTTVAKGLVTYKLG
jgi:acyl-coenzyme A thioesterase PaaI-like protein